VSRPAASRPKPRCAGEPGALPPPPRQRGRCPHTRVPSIDECSLHPARAGDHEEPVTVLTALPPRSGFRRPFAPRAHSMNSSADEARPAPVGAGQTPLVDFCNQTIREHDRWVVRTPISAVESCLPVARAPVEPKPTGAIDQVTSPLDVHRSLSTLPDDEGDASRGFTGQGPWAFARRRPSSRLLAARALPQPDRLEHLLS
jgi:hypothetical protein